MAQPSVDGNLKKMACLSKLGGAAPPAPLDPPLLMEGLLRLGMPNSSI